MDLRVISLNLPENHSFFKRKNITQINVSREKFVQSYIEIMIF